MDSRFRDVALFGLSGVVLAMWFQGLKSPDLEVPNPSVGSLEGGVEVTTVHQVTHHLTGDPFAAALDVEGKMLECAAKGKNVEKECDYSAGQYEISSRIVDAKKLRTYLNHRRPSDTSTNVKGSSRSETATPNKVNVVGVLMDRSNRAEAAEQRRRLRFALQSAMESAGFRRPDTDHIGILEVPPKSLSRSTTAEEPSGEPDNKVDQKSILSHLVPFEAFFKGDTPAKRIVSDEWNQAEATVVFWLDEEIYLSARDKVCHPTIAQDPLERVRGLILLIEKGPEQESAREAAKHNYGPNLAGKGFAGKGMLNEPREEVEQVQVEQVLVLGPSGSASLAAMTAELRARVHNGSAVKPKKEIHLVSPVAIIENSDLVAMTSSGCTDARSEDARKEYATPIPPQVALDRWYRAAGIQLSRINALQSSLTSLVEHELNRRAASRWPGAFDWIRDKTPTKLVISESQRLYAQKLGGWRTHETPVSGVPGSESERESQCLFNLTFFGDINRVRSNTGQGQVSTAANAPGTSTQAYSKQYEAEGPQNYDYVSRLVREATRRVNNPPREGPGCGQVASVEIYGGTLPDKLTLVRAFRKAFPQAVLVTDHLDARFRDSSHSPFTRNMLVTTPFGLDLQGDLELVRTSFRGSEQTAYAKALHFGLGGHRGNPVGEAWGTACLVELGISDDHPLGGACATEGSLRRLGHERLSVPVTFFLMTVVVGVFTWVSLRMIVRPVHPSVLPSVSRARELAGYKVDTPPETANQPQPGSTEKGIELVQGAKVAWMVGWAVFGFATLLLVSLTIYWLWLTSSPLTEGFVVKGFPIPISATRGEHLAVFDGVSPIGPAWLRSLSVICGLLFLWRFNELYVESRTDLDKARKGRGEGDGAGLSSLFVVREWDNLAKKTTLRETIKWGALGALLALALMEFLLWFLGDPVIQSRDPVIGGIAWISARLGSALLFAMLTIVMFVYWKSKNWIENVEKEARDREDKRNSSGGGGSLHCEWAGIHHKEVTALGGGLKSAGIEEVLNRYTAPDGNKLQRLVGIHLFKAAESTINLKIVEYHTERVARFVYAPFLLLALLVLSTWTWLGPFTWTTGAAVVLVTVIVWQILVAISWQWQGRRFRASQIRVIERAREEIDLLCTRNNDSVRDAEKAASQLLGIATRVERGVFRDVLHQPYLAALLFPAGAGGVLTLVDRLLQAG